jgi:hypothetical protein
MSKLYIVAKSTADADILRRMLPQVVRREIDFVVADDDPVAAISTARTLLALRGQPVGLVIDTYTADETEIASKRQVIEGLLGKAAPNLAWRLFTAVPDLRTVWEKRGALDQIPLAQEIREFFTTVQDNPDHGHR